MVSDKDVTKAWKEGKKRKGNSMFTDGITVYSWGEHFPIATKIGNKILFNSDKYSNSTSKHQSYTRSVCDDYVECNTEQIIEAINSPNEPIIIVKEIQHDTIQACLENMKIIFNLKKKRFPMKKMNEYITSEFV